MKKGLQTSILISTGMIAGTGLGVGAFVLYQNAKPIPSHIEYEWYEYDKTGLGFKILEADIKDNGGVRFLGEAGVRELSKMIKEKLSYGPEIFGLKSIVIGDENVIDEDTNGLYFPSTNEIFINTKSSREMGFDLTTEPTHIKDIKNRVSLLFDIIFHEYGHYLAHTYINSVDSNSQWSTKDIYNVHNGNIDPWDKDFVTEFESLLYNDGKKYTTTDKINNSKYQSIGGTFTAQDIYEMINKTDGNETEEKLEGQNFVLSGPDPTYILTDNAIIDKSSLEYIFSLPEIWTRKYQQLMMGLNETEMYNKQRIDSKGWFMYGHNSNATNLLSDALSYQKSLTENDRYLGDWVFNDPSLPFDPSIKKREVGLYDLMDRHMGHTKGADISIIWHKNEDRILLNTSGPSIKYGDDTNAEMLKFGGYIDSSASFNYIGYWEGQDYVPLSKIIKENHNFKMKEKLNSQTRLPLEQSLENIFYVTEKFLSANSLEDKVLVFSEDEQGTNAEELKSARINNDGFATTWRPDQKSSIKNPYRAYNLNGKIVIKKATW